jgi:hypothetical protein
MVSVVSTPVIGECGNSASAVMYSPEPHEGSNIFVWAVAVSNKLVWTQDL